MSQGIRVLVFGCGGQVGSDLVDILSSASPCVARQDPGFEVTGVDVADIDLTDTGGIGAFIDRHDPHWVINAAAHTAVDRAESEQALSEVLNADAPAAMAAACASAGRHLVHYSTDYVFDGSGDRPYRETDAVNPRSVYGRTKAAGEAAVLDALPDAIILRTAWVYSRAGRNFVNTMLRLAAERDEINVVDDQVGSPTLARDLARATVDILCAIGSGQKTHQGGIFHATNRGQTSWYGFCREIFRLAGIDGVRVNAISTEQYPTPAPRPAYSVLDNSRLREVYGVELPPWQQSLAGCLEAAMQAGHPG